MIDLRKKDPVADAVKELLQQEGWDDMVKSAKDTLKDKPQDGASGVKKGSRYGGSKQKDEKEPVKEELKGDQHKIDKNKNKKIDAEDFKILRKEETVEEGIKDLAKKAFKAITGGSDEDQRKNLQKKMGIPQTGKMGMAKQNEEVEQIDEELKTKTAYVPYVHTDRHGNGFGGFDVHYAKEADAKAHVDRHGHTEVNGKKGWVEKHEITKHPVHGGWVDANSMRRNSVHEETEQLDELKKSTVKSYIAKKTDQMHNKAGERMPSMNRIKKDMSSMQGAHDRNTGVKPTSEEIGQVDERSLTPSEEKTKEHNVKSMKKGFSGFRERYGKDAKSVMYATATKQAKNEETVVEARTPQTDNPPFDPPYNTSSGTEVVDKSGAKHTPMSRVKHLARQAMKKVKKDLGSK